MNPVYPNSSTMSENLFFRCRRRSQAQESQFEIILAEIDAVVSLARIKSLIEPSYSNACNDRLSRYFPRIEEAVSG